MQQCTARMRCNYVCVCVTWLTTQTGTKVSDSEASYGSSSESDSESESDSASEIEASIRRGEVSGNVLAVVALVFIGISLRLLLVIVLYRVGQKNDNF